MKKTKIFEKAEFATREEAKYLRARSENKLKKSKIGLIISGVATLFSVIGMAPGDGALKGFCLTFAFLGAVAAYIVGGGFGIALRLAKKLAFIGWFIAPFPVDILTFFATFFLSAYAFLFVPVVFVFVNFIQQKRNIAAANEFLNATADFAASPAYTAPASPSYR